MQDERGKLSDELREFLSGERRDAFELLNFEIIRADRLIDAMKIPDSLWQEMLDCVTGRPAKVRKELEGIDRLLKTFAALPRGTHFRQLLANYLLNEIANVGRRWQIIDRTLLRSLQDGCGPFFVIELMLLFPDFALKDLNDVGHLYALGAKIADDVMDFSEDVKNGLLNVGAEDMAAVQGIRIVGRSFTLEHDLIPRLSPSYTERELKLADTKLQQADASARKRGIAKGHVFETFRGLMRSWLDEALTKGGR